MNQIIRRKRTKQPKMRRVLPVNKTFKTVRENTQRFAEFAKDKPHKVVEIKRKVVLSFPPFSPFELLLGKAQKEQISENIYKIASIFGDIYFFQSEIKVGEKYVFDDGVYQEFYKHFQTNLMKGSDIDLDKELNSFLKFYFVMLNPKTRGAKQKQVSKQTIELAKKGLNASQITNTFAEKKFEEFKESYLSEGFSADRAENMAKKDVKVWKYEKTKRVQECLRYNGFSKRNPKKTEN